MPVSTVSAVVARLRSAGCVFAEDEADLLIATARTPGELDAMVERRVEGLPLEHVLGWAGFRGLRVAVDPGVFVPRRRTEFLVERALELAPSARVVLDLCCGSGAVGLALATALGTAASPGSVDLYAADIEPAAVACARRNLTPVGGRVHEGDLYAPLPRDLRGWVDILAANVPYVPSDEVELLPAEARLHEPRVSLDGGPDGLDVMRRVTAEAPEWLAPGGVLLFETSERQASKALEAVVAAGLDAQAATSDDLHATVITGRRAGNRVN